MNALSDSHLGLRVEVSVSVRGAGILVAKGLADGYNLGAIGKALGKMPAPQTGTLKWLSLRAQKYLEALSQTSLRLIGLSTEIGVKDREENGGADVT